MRSGSLSAEFGFYHGPVIKYGERTAAFLRAVSVNCLVGARVTKCVYMQVCKQAYALVHVHAALMPLHTRLHS
jgi:hypothetical protein